MFIRSAIALAVSLTLAGAPSLAVAQSSSRSSEVATFISLADIEARFAADGFRIVEIERYANVIEVKGFDRNGLCVELYLDRRSGETLRRERDNDCIRDRRSFNDHHRSGDDHHRGGDDHHRGGGHGGRHGGGHD